MSKRRLILILAMAAVAIAAFTAEPALAQCAMCRQTVEASSDVEAASRGLNLAVLVLLIPPVAIFAGIFGVFYRYRDFHAKRQN
ncbi:MAG TPA: hypothetical protein VNO14_08205 [Blastocatellia bacterium]|nr:hypothetical protein [Blastocatellia bacterium]